MTGIHNKLKNLFTSRVRRQLSVFLICLVIAVVLWFLLMVPNQKSQPIKYPVVFTNIPAGKVLVSVSENYLYLKFNTPHFKVINEKYLRRSIPLSIDLSVLKLSRVDGHYESSLPTKGLATIINTQFGTGKQITITYPDTLFFVFKDAIPEQTKVPLSELSPEGKPFPKMLCVSDHDLLQKAIRND
jgi:hypothetical protein